MSTLKIFLLGPFQATYADKPLEHFDTNKTRALLAYLALERAVPQPREFLAGLLWPNYSNANALRNLRLTLFRLRQILGQKPDEGTQSGEDDFPVLLDRHSVQLNPRYTTWVDIQEFEMLLTRCSLHEHANPIDCAVCIKYLSLAVSYFRGDFLDGFFLKDSFGFDEWLILHRERTRQKMLDTLDQLSRHFLRKAEYSASLGERKLCLDKTHLYSQQALRMEPWRETAHQQMMKAYALVGQTQEALTQYKTCRQILASEFKVEPDPETIKLYQQIRGKTFDTRPINANMMKGVQPPPHNLPPQLTPLIGRETQLTRLVSLLSSYRWVTLVGQGGIGKTRLALATAEQILPRYPDGIWYIPLADENLPPAVEGNREEIHHLIAQTIARKLGLVFQEQASPIQPLLDYLRGKKLLLILDSFEQLTAGADFILDLLVQAPEIHILVTSRQFLHFQAGYVMRVDGLPVPESEDDPEGQRYASVQLFTERVERLSGSFRLDDHSLPAMIRICKLLDGIPLAIELAAPWVNKRSLDEIAHAIQTDIGFLSTSMEGIPERHRSMNAVFEGSWNLLDDNEQRVLGLCSALQGEFTYEQALTVSQATPRDIENLVDKLFIIRVAPGRYQFHETLRQFTAEKIK